MFTWKKTSADQTFSQLRPVAREAARRSLNPQRRRIIQTCAILRRAWLQPCLIAAVPPDNVVNTSAACVKKSPERPDRWACALNKATLINNLITTGVRRRRRLWCIQGVMIHRIQKHRAGKSHGVKSPPWRWWDFQMVLMFEEIYEPKFKFEVFLCLCVVCHFPLCCSAGTFLFPLPRLLEPKYAFHCISCLIFCYCCLLR